MDLLQGTLDVLILRTLRMGPAHGHAPAGYDKPSTTRAGLLPEESAVTARRRA